LDQHGAIGRMQVANAGDGLVLKQAEKFPDPLVSIEGDSFVEIEE